MMIAPYATSFVSVDGHVHLRAQVERFRAMAHGKGSDGMESKGRWEQRT